MDLEICLCVESQGSTTFYKVDRTVQGEVVNTPSPEGRAESLGKMI